MSALVQAGREFAVDEKRRRARGQRTRMADAPLARLELDIRAAEATTVERIDDPTARTLRGELAVGIFGYRDDFDEQAASVIVDILHAATANGCSPQAVLDQAAAYYAEERSR